MTDGRNIFVCGRTGSGKTWLLQRQLLIGVRRLIVYLPKREEVGYAGIYFDAFNQERSDFYRAWLDAWSSGGNHRLIYRPDDPFETATFDRICMGVYHAGDCTFVAEDLAGYVNERSGLGAGFKTLLTAGRTRGVTTYLVTQRPYRIPREVTSQAREAYLFATHEPNDVAYIREAFGVDAAAAMERAGQYEYVHWIETGKVEVGKA
ncbi:MAG: hypothetical protein PHS60_01860, partial [Zavarzinia sp.]|nr:hypothetical protein [Zavarzinia sp.]